MFTPFKERSLVRTKVNLKDMHGRLVPAGSEGYIVHINPTAPDKPPAYVLDIRKVGAPATETNMFVVDATHDHLELVKEA